MKISNSINTKQYERQIDNIKFEKMKKRRWAGNSGSKNSYSHPMSKLDKHLGCVVFAVIFVYLWIMLVVYYVDNRNSGNALYPIEKRGLIFDLEKESFHFQINGFEYFTKSPLKRRPNLVANKVWFLRPLNKGSIEMKNLQQNKPTQVSILIKYHIPWGSRSKLAVTGVNDKTHEVVTTELSQYGNGYCTSVIFLGLVHQVVVEGAVVNNRAFVIIDKLLVGFGLFVFDGLEEESCS